jgi:N-acetylmuramoyl-L-alanine amidase
VQIATSTKKLELIPQNFNGLDDINVYEEYKLYKYTLGSFETLEDAKKALGEAKQKGYSDAFLIAFYQDKKISIKEAQQLNP